MFAGLGILLLVGVLAAFGPVVAGLYLMSRLTRRDRERPASP